MKNISIIGFGKFGLCFGLTLERAGYSVLGIDLKKEYIESINNKTFKSSENNVESYLKISKNLKASTNLKDAIEYSDIIFVIVATNSLPDGRYDHSQIDNLIEKIKLFGIQKYTKHLIICCTTMPEYCDSVQEKLKKYNYIVSYNPEFIAQGTILKNQQEPDIVLIGEGSKEAGDLIENIYLNHTTNNPKIHRMSRTEAELCKISLNCFLTTKIAYANMIGDIAIRSGCSPKKILSAIGSDSRIGNKYIDYGFGFGGPCFPRDNKALIVFAKEKNINACISKASDESNNLHLKYQIEQFIKDNPDKTKEIIIDYLTYKKESILLTESQQFKFAKSLKDHGYKIIVNDKRPEVLSKIGGLFE